MWWQNVALVGTVLGELLTIVLLVGTAAGWAPGITDQVKTVGTLIIQLITSVLALVWHNNTVKTFKARLNIK